MRKETIQEIINTCKKDENIQIDIYTNTNLTCERGLNYLKLLEVKPETISLNSDSLIYTTKEGSQINIKYNEIKQIRIE